MSSGKRRPKTITSQFLRLKECEEKIRQKIFAELDDIHRLLENTKDTYQPMDESIADAEFSSKVIYLTERQNVESKKSRRFSPAQVYEQAVFEAYFRDEFNMPEIGEIEDASDASADGRNINGPFSASDFLFSDKSDTNARFVSVKLENMVESSVSSVGDHDNNSCDEDVESKRTLSSEKIESKRRLSIEKSELKKHQLSKRTESRRPSLTGKVESKTLSSGNAKRVYNQNSSNNKIRSKSSEISESIESAKPPLTEKGESKKLPTIVVQPKRIESTEPLLIEKVKAKNLSNIVLYPKRIESAKPLLVEKVDKKNLPTIVVSKRIESIKPLSLEKDESKKLSTIVVHPKRIESPKPLLIEKIDKKKLPSIIVHSNRVYNENDSVSSNQKIGFKNGQSSDRMESGRPLLIKKVESKKLPSIIVHSKKNESAKPSLSERSESKKLRSIIMHSKQVFNEKYYESGHQEMDTKRPQSSERIESPKLSLNEKGTSKNVSPVIVNFGRVGDESDSVTSNKKIEKRFKRIFDYATSDGLPTKSIRINSQEPSDSKITNENMDVNKNLATKRRRTNDSDLRDRIKQRATRRVFFNPNFIDCDPERFKPL